MTCSDWTFQAAEHQHHHLQACLRAGALSMQEAITMSMTKDSQTVN